MALTTNQGLELPDGTDNANVPLSMTQYNAGVENRLVQRYLSIADRTARNPLPNEGELSYLTDLNIYETFYPGPGWLPTIGEYNWTSSVVAYNSVSAAFTTAGGPLVGLAMRAGITGRLRVGFSGQISNTAGTAIIAPQLNTGSVVGAGAVVAGSSDAFAISTATTQNIQSANNVMFAGLTPGLFYNIFLQHRVQGGNGAFDRRTMEMSQV